MCKMVLPRQKLARTIRSMHSMLEFLVVGRNRGSCITRHSFLGYMAPRPAGPKDCYQPTRGLVLPGFLVAELCTMVGVDGGGQNWRKVAQPMTNLPSVAENCQLSILMPSTIMIAPINV